jgi:predicted GNAT family acetyltransferase
MLEIRNDNRMNAPASLVTQPVELLRDDQETEVLDFLAANPSLSFVMTGWIKDNGLVNKLNRGSFYATRNGLGHIDGVALIGHVTCFDTNSDAACAAFADLARNNSETFLLLGEEQRLSRFMSFYAPDSTRSHSTSRQLLFEQRSRVNCESTVPDLRRATLEELDLIVPVHAQMAFEQSGVNPLDVDAAGFRDRCARRIQQGRIWVCVENGQLVFKADVVIDVPDVNYLEGVYLRPESRGRGLASACVRQLTNVLLAHTKSVCLLTEENESAAQACYLRAGFKLREYYQTVFLQQETSGSDN